MIILQLLVFILQPNVVVTVITYDCFRRATQDYLERVSVSVCVYVCVQSECAYIFSVSIDFCCKTHSYIAS